MALALTHKAGSGINATPSSSSSVAFANSTLYLVSVEILATSGGSCSGCSLSGQGFTWTPLVSTAANRRRLFWVVGYVDSGATTGTLTITPTFSSGVISGGCYSIDEITGSAATAGNNGTDAFRQTAVQEVATASSSSVTLATFGDATNNIAIGASTVFGNAAMTAEGGYSTLMNFHDALGAMLVEYILGQDLAVTSTFGSANRAAVAGELVMSGGAAGQTDFVGVLPI